MKLVVHIGSHKAGSTTIQDYCSLNQDYLLGHGICYPTGFFRRYPQQHSELRELLIQNRMEIVREFFERVTLAARAHGAETVFLSGEDMSALGPGLAHRFQTATLKYFDTTQIVLLVRNKKEFFYSLYKHQLLHGPPTEESNFAKRQRFSPVSCVAAWQNIKGVTMTVISFETIKRDLLTNFFKSVFGLEVSDNMIHNRSPDYLTLQIMNSFLKGQGEEVERILMTVNERYPIEFSLPIEDVIATSIDAQYPDNEWDVPGVVLGEAILQKRMISSDNIDSVILCTKMINLFTELKAYFEQTELAAVSVDE